MRHLTRLDNRVEAHLDGLRVAGDADWDVCAVALQIQASGEIFAASVLALESRDPGCIRRVYEAVIAAPETARGLISAIGWAPRASLQGPVKGLLTSESPFWRGIGMRACAVHRVDPGTHLAQAMEDEDVGLRVRALRTAGELGRRDLLGVLSKQCR